MLDILMCIECNFKRNSWCSLKLTYTRNHRWLPSALRLKRVSCEAFKGEAAGVMGKGCHLDSPPKLLCKRFSSEVSVWSYSPLLAFTKFMISRLLQGHRPYCFPQTPYTLEPGCFQFSPNKGIVLLNIFAYSTSHSPGFCFYQLS